MRSTTAQLRSPTRRGSMLAQVWTETPARIAGNWFKRLCGFTPSTISVLIGFADWQTRHGNHIDLLDAPQPAGPDGFAFMNISSGTRALAAGSTSLISRRANSQTHQLTW